METLNEKTTHALLKKTMRMMLTILKLCPRQPSPYAMSDEDIQNNKSHPADKSSTALRGSVRASESNHGEQASMASANNGEGIVDDRSTTKDSNGKSEKRRYWTEDEHKRFLEALSKYGPHGMYSNNSRIKPYPTSTNAILLIRSACCNCQTRWYKRCQASAHT